MDDEAVLAGPVAQRGEGLGRVVDTPVAAEDIDGVHGAGAEGFGDGEQVVLAEPEDVFSVELGRDGLRRRLGAGWPPPSRVELADSEAVVGEKVPHVGVAEAVVATSLVVAAP